MSEAIIRWLKVVYKNVITSIAFLPAVIAVSFLAVSILMIRFDFSQTGKNLKGSLHWLSLKDASTARSICSSFAGGIISLAVFSFSMVMILLSQAAAQMSNRILGKLISNRFQQVVLGFYIGTIVYALFLLSTIRDVNSGIYVPAISVYLLITLTIVDIFLFIYFLHYITQSVKFETIIHRIYDDTSDALKKSCTVIGQPEVAPKFEGAYQVNALESGLYEGFERDSLIKLCKEENAVVFFNYPIGTYVIANTPLLKVARKGGVSKKLERKIWSLVHLGREQEIGTSYYYGLRQLMEIAIKALSPGINDPGTAAISLHAIGDLLAFRMIHSPVICYRDDESAPRIIANEKSFDDLFDDYVLPIWDYGKDDRLIQKEMLHVMSMLELIETRPAVRVLRAKIKEVVI